MENSSTSVGKSIKRRASSADTAPQAIMATAPIIAAAGRLIFNPGNLPMAKTK